MLIAGMTVGAFAFYFSASSLCPGVSSVPLAEMLIILLIGFTMFPVPPSMDIHGWHEMYPLNGPAWSLFYEYIGSFLYALVFRRLPKYILAILTLLAGAALIRMTVMGPFGDAAAGHLIGGWSLEHPQLQIGFTRLLYPFLAGLLLFRLGKLIHIRYAFLWSSLAVIAILSIPRICPSGPVWINGLYESLSVVILFPIIVLLGAGGNVETMTGKSICRFLGDISYPVYIVHYPLIYIYTGMVADGKLKGAASYTAAAAVFAGSVALAYGLFRVYDLPVRTWLKKIFLDKAAKK